MKFECYSDWKQLPDSANILFEQSTKDNIFNSRVWFECLSNSALKSEQTMLLGCVLEDKQVKAILPLLQESATTWNSLTHRYTPHYNLLIADENHEQILSCLVQGLAQLPFSGLILEPVAGDDRNLIALKNAMESADFHCEWLFRHYNWVYKVAGQSFQEYLAARPARLRNTISRKKRKLEREQGYEIGLFSGNDVAEKLPDYYAVYNASWKANEQFRGLVDDLVDRFSRSGWTRLAMLYIQGKPAAAQLWFVCDGKASIFRLSYDEAWKIYSPGTILTSFLMEHVIDIEKVVEIDFLTGNDAYKQDWMSERQERLALSCIKNKKQIPWFVRIIGLFRI